MTLRQLITNHEGRKSKPYKCPAGHKTIGVGWNIEANPLPDDIAAHLEKNGSITGDMIDRLLDISIRHAVADCKVLFPTWGAIHQTRQMALTDFVFQLGFSRARRFVKSIAAINTGRWDDAADEMLDSAWARQTPNRAITITDMIRYGEDCEA